MTDQTTNLLLLGSLVLNAIILVVVLIVAAKAGKPQPAPKAAKPAVGLSPVERERLEAAAKEKTDAEVSQMIAALRKDMEGFSKDLKNVLLGDATTTLRTQLDQAKQLLAATIENLNLTVVTAGNEASAQLKEGVEQQKRLLIEQFEQHMAEVITSYLVTALGTESAQSDQAAQALKQLEAHKEDIQKDLLHEV